MDDRLGKRNLFLDASRGFAMLLVCISHFGIGYFGQAGDMRDRRITSLLALPATPTFVLLSGLLLGFLSVRNKAGFADLSLKLMDRGLFLLGPAHLLIVIAHLLAFDSARFVFITDVIGVCILTGPWLITRLSGNARLAIGAGILIATWIVCLEWIPSGSVSGLVRSIFIGDEPFRHGWLAFPLLPWFGSYLAATVLGEKVAQWMADGSPWVERIGGVSLMAFAAGAAVHVLGRGRPVMVKDLLSGLHKYPPGPAYLLGCGGWGLGLVTMMGWLERQRRMRPVLQVLAVVGRSSLVVFIFQYFVYYVAFHYLRLPVTHLWPAHLAASLLMIFAVALWWDRYVGNDYLTVGLPILWRGRQRVVAPTRE